MTRARRGPPWGRRWVLLLHVWVMVAACSHPPVTGGEGAEDPFLPQVYTDPRFGFSLHYPAALHVTRPQPGQDRVVVVFTSAAGEATDGFQITVDAFESPGPSCQNSSNGRSRARSCGISSPCRWTRSQP